MEVHIARYLWQIILDKARHGYTSTASFPKEIKGIFLYTTIFILNSPFYVLQLK